MNLTAIVNAIGREIDKEVEKVCKKVKEEYDKAPDKILFSSREVRNFYDRAASIVLTREFDKYRKNGGKL